MMSDAGTKAKALALLKEAQDLEAAGNAMAAVEKYRVAYKLDPSLEEGVVDESVTDPTDGESLFLPHRTPPASYGFRTFDADDALVKGSEGNKAALDFFEEEGYLVLTNIMTEEENARCLELFVKYFEAAADIDVTSRASLQQRFADPTVGILGKRSAGHSALNWFTRSRPKVKQGFRLALGLADSDKLITSFDGMNMFRNPEVDPSWQGATQPWLHVDAGDEHTSHYVQGVVNHLDCTDDSDAGLVLMPGSHRTVFPILCPEKRLENPCLITYVGPVEERRIAALGLSRTRPMRVPLPARSLVMWKSSVVHCNIGCVPRREPRPQQLVRRVVSYVCMMKDPMDPELTKRRVEMFEGGRTACHQPDLCRWTGDSRPSGTEGAVICAKEDLPEGAAELL